MQQTKTAIVPIRERKLDPPRFKAQIFEEFVVWYALPNVERIKLGIVDQADFIKLHNLGKNTPTLWKKRPDFEERVRQYRKEWAFGKTNDVIYAIYHSAIGGGREAPQAQKLWLQYFEGFTEKNETTVKVQPEISQNDIRFLIEALPEPLRTKHYANLRELIDDAHAVRNAHEIDDGAWDERPPIALQGETDHVPQDIQGQEAHELASLHPQRIRLGLERKVSTCHHQSSTRRREIKAAWYDRI